MDKFLKRKNYWKWLKKKVDYLNRPVTNKDVEPVIKTLPTKKNQDQMALWLNSTKH